LLMTRVKEVFTGRPHRAGRILDNCVGLWDTKPLNVGIIRLE
jgi:hypothetical protein